MTAGTSGFGYERVVDGLLALIRTENLEAGAQLPTLPAIQDRFGVSSTTARRAVDELKRRHIIESRQGSGLFVKTRPNFGGVIHIDETESVSAALDELRRELRTLGDRLAQVEGDLRELQSGRSGEPDGQSPRPARKSRP